MGTITNGVESWQRHHKEEGGEQQRRYVELPLTWRCPMECGAIEVMEGDASQGNYPTRPWPGVLRLRRLDNVAHHRGAAQRGGMLGHADGTQHGGALGNGVASRERTGGADG